MNQELCDQIQAEQDHGRQKYGRGPDDTSHDDRHTISDWASYIRDHVTRATHATPMEARQHLVKVAGLACSAIESMDRQEASHA